MAVQDHTATHVSSRTRRPRARNVRVSQNTGDKLRGAHTPRPVDGDSATAVPADYHAALQLLPRLVSFIALFDGGKHAPQGCLLR